MEINFNKLPCVGQGCFTRWRAASRAGTATRLPSKTRWRGDTTSIETNGDKYYAMIIDDGGYWSFSDLRGV